MTLIPLPLNKNCSKQWTISQLIPVMVAHSWKCYCMVCLGRGEANSTQSIRIVLMFNELKNYIALSTIFHFSLFRVEDQLEVNPKEETSTMTMTTTFTIKPNRIFAPIINSSWWQMRNWITPSNIVFVLHLICIS